LAVNPIYNDCYFIDGNGFEESKSVFILANEIPQKAKESAGLTIGELGFGTGLNLLTTLSCLQESAAVRIQYYSVEKHPLSKGQIDEIISEYSWNYPEIYAAFLENYDKLFCEIKPGFNSVVWRFGETELAFNLYFGDVLDFLGELDAVVDCWYLDGHSPHRNPEMWTEEVCNLLFEKSRVGTTLATFTACGLVKENLRTAGFFVKRMKGFGRKKHRVFGERVENNEWIFIN
jgi:tRNA 5-methylaminomethyl-2-thiouridine biosynthesis bifunctional protein